MRMFLYTLIGGFFIGVAVRSLSEMPFALTLTCALLGLVPLVVVGLVQYRVPRAVILCGLFLAASAMGVLRTEMVLPIAYEPLESRVGTKATLEGVVVREPDVRENQTLLTVALHKTGGEEVARVLVHAPRRTTVRYGDTVALEGTLARPEPFTTDHDTMFDYPRYLAKDGILYEMKFAKVSVMETGNGGIVGTLLHTKQTFINALNRVVREPESALAAGLLVGAKRSLGEKITEEFRTVGLTHIVVLSGFNLTVVAVAVLFLLGALPKRARLLSGVVAIAAFTMMTGAGAAAVRAAIMASLALLSRTLARATDVLHLLALASFFMVAWNPLILLADPSFQLSVIATAGLVMLSPRFEQRLARVPESAGLRAIVGATLATQLAVLPLLVSMTGQFSLIALLANLAVLPIVPLTMLITFLAGAVALVSTPVSAPLALLAHALLSYILHVAHTLSRVPFATLTVPAPPGWMVLIVYVAAGVYFVYHLRVRARADTSKPVLPAQSASRPHPSSLH